jgi:REP element-mobilizing transposase RayT
MKVYYVHYSYFSGFYYLIIKCKQRCRIIPEQDLTEYIRIFTYEWEQSQLPKRCFHFRVE